MNASPSPDPRTGEPDVAEVAHRLRLATARLARLMRQQVGTGLSPSQYSVLVSIEHNGSLTLGELAALDVLEALASGADRAAADRTADRPVVP